MATIPSYYEGLLSEDDMSSLRNQALASGLLSAGAAFSRAGAPSMMPQGSGFSDALQGFQTGYKGEVDTALQNMLKATQVQELVRKQKEAQQLKQLYASAYVPPKQTAIPSEVGPAVTETPASFDMTKIIPQLIGGGYIDKVKEAADAATALRESGLYGGSGMKQSDIAGQVKEAIQTLGIKDASGRLKTPDMFTDEDRVRVSTYISSSDINKSPKINLSDPTAVAKAQSENVKDFNTQIKNPREVATRYSGMVQAYKESANPATDSTLVYGLAKIYDPSGAVQQGDIKTIVGNPNVPQRIQIVAQQFTRGGSLSQEQRDNLMSTAYFIVKDAKERVQPDVDTYKSFSKSFGANPDQIRNPFDSIPKPDAIMVTVGGKQVKAKKAADDSYYIQRGDQYFKVSD